MAIPAANAKARIVGEGNDNFMAKLLGPAYGPNSAMLHARILTESHAGFAVPGYSQFTIQGIPNLSRAIPKALAQKVFCKGI